jgi:hypothetical protein
MEKTAEYQFSTSVNEGFLEVILTGKLITSDVEGLQIKLTDIIQETGVKALLVDSRAVDGSNISITEIFITARRQPGNEPKAITAVVDRLENADSLSFLENTAFNAGWSLKWFTDIDAARTWLKSKQIKK